MTSIVIQTTCGAVQGCCIDGLYHFKGIPYAEPPIGRLRFCAPIPKAPWTGIWDATIPRSAPPQQCSPRGGQNRSAFSLPQSEDCLYLNILSDSLCEKRPVVVTIHGGGNISGSCNESTYDASYLVKKSGVVHVAIEFRIGIFGFLYHPQINTQPLNSMDILLGLTWIRDNISQFGGDPENITLIGFSSGANNIADLLPHLPETRLFHRAILCSGSLGRCWFSRQEAVRISTGILRIAGVPDNSSELAEHARKIEASVLIDAAYRFAQSSIEPSQWGMLWRPVSDEAVCLRDKMQLEGSAAAKAGIPLMIGHASDEQTRFYPNDPAAAHKETLALYKKPAHSLAQAVSQAGGLVWLYEFSWYPPGSPQKASHGIQLPFLYRKANGWNDIFSFLPRTADPEMAALCETYGDLMADYFHGCYDTLERSWPPYTQQAPYSKLFNGKDDPVVLSE